MASFLTCQRLCNTPNTIHKSRSESMGWHCLGNPSHWKILQSREGSSCLVFLLIIQPVAYHLCWEHLPAFLQKREYGRERRNFACLRFLLCSLLTLYWSPSGYRILEWKSFSVRNFKGMCHYLLACNGSVESLKPFWLLSLCFLSLEHFGVLNYTVVFWNLAKLHTDVLVLIMLYTHFLHCLEIYHISLIT